jgi:microcystin-dependent protein
MGYLTPETLPVEVICRQLLIPDDPVFTAAFTGALLPLTHAYNWELYGAITPDEAAAKAFDMLQQFLEGSACMIGSVAPFATHALPAGVLPCDGSIYQRVDYPLLYELLDSAFIIDADSFQTPDLRGRAVIGAGQGSGLANRVIGDSGGEETHQLTEAELAAHSHSYTPPIFNVDIEAPGAPDLFAAGIGAPTATSSAGGDSAHNNMQPYLVLTWGIVAR